MMKRKNATRSALFTSIISLLLCVSMLVGTTFAWFTDEVKSGTNVIAAGNLDIELYHSNKAVVEANDTNKVKTDTILFDDVDPDLWEPGALAYENFMVVNEGNLALRYDMNLSVLNETVVKDGTEQYKLSDVIMVGVKAGGFTSTTRQGVIDEVTNWTKLSAFSLDKNGVMLEADASESFGLVLYWQPNSAEIDNRYNMNNGKTTTDGGSELKLDIGINLFATQEMEESDSFGKDYDEAAANVAADGSASVTVNTAPSAADNTTTVDAPAGTFKHGDEVTVEVETENTLFNINSQGAVVASLDVTLTVNGEEQSAELEDGKYFTVTTYISTGLADVAVKYVGDDAKDQPINVNYDPETGKLTFQTNHFSEYEVSAKAFGYNGDTAYSTAKEVADAIVAGTDVSVADTDKPAVVGAAGSTADKNDIVDALAVATVSNIGGSKYLTFAEAMNAVAANGTLTLLADVAVDADETFTITNGLTIDLNKHTLSGVSDQTGKNRMIINVAKGGNLTVKNGTVTVEHIGTNMGWNNSTSAIEAVSGGKLTLDHVHVINLGGSDMAYAVNIANNGGATLKTIASTLESKNYVALRIFNNADGAINVDLTEGTVLTGNSGPFWVHFWTEADLGEKMAARQAYLNVNFNDTQISRYSGSKSLVRFGFTDSVYYSDTAMTEVVAGTEKALYWAITSGKNVLLNNDITITNNLLNIISDTVINGNGNTLTYTGSDSRVIDVTKETNGADLTIKNLNIEINNNYCQRGINYNTNGKLVLDNVKLTGATKATYGINLPSGSADATVKMKNCDITALIALNIWGENIVANVTDCHLSNYDNNAVEGENYATVKLNNDGTYSAEGTVITITGGSITAKDETGEAFIAINNNTATGAIVVSDTTVVNGITATNVAVVRYKDGNGNFYNEFYGSTTLQSAVTLAAKTANAEVFLLTDITVDTLDVPANITVHKNGHNLTIGATTGSGTPNIVD